ncbi:MAG: hypothetical protein Q4B61_04710 [Bacteroidales bacterium]|nr:hypothetical protein [Bacteroidales bacterium]
MKQIGRYLVLFLLLFASVASVKADVVDQTEKQITANAQRVKSDIDNLMSNINSMISKADDAIDKARDDFKDAGKVKDILKEYMKEVKGLKISDFKKLDTKELQKKFKEIGDRSKSFGNLPDSFKKSLDSLSYNIDKTLFDIKNIASVIFTAPVQLKGGYGRAGMCISIDTLRYVRKEDGIGYNAIDVRADFQLPFSVSEKGGSTKIGFIGKNVMLAGEGESRIKVSMDENKAEKKYKMFGGRCNLVVDSASYVAIDCNGFKQMRLKGYFEFSPKVIYPADLKRTSKPLDQPKINIPQGDQQQGDQTQASQPQGDQTQNGQATPGDQSAGDQAQAPAPQTATSKDSMIKATFDVMISDLEDIVIELGIGQKFKVKGTGDVVYQVTGMVADMSTVRNADNFEFPQGYNSPFPSGDKNYWTGFALKLVEVDLSDEVDCLDKLTFKAYNMLIDETGFSGWFSAAIAYSNEKEQPTKESARVDQVVQAGPSSTDAKADKVMTAKIDRLAIGIISNKVNGGELSGSITVKGLKNEKEGKDFQVTLSGKLYTDAKDEFCYDFNAKVQAGAKFNLPFAKDKCQLTLGAGTYIGYMKEPDSVKIEGTDIYEYCYKKGFYFNLNGGVDFKAGFVSMEGLRFQNLRFSTYPKYFGGGTFSLDCAKSANLGGLELSLHDLTASLDTTAGNMMAQLKASVKLALISDGDGASVDARFRLMSDVENHWKVSKVRVERIEVDVHFSAFKLLGSIETFGDETPDPIWGKGYAGAIEISMDKPQFAVKVGAKFGRTPTVNNVEGFKYWFVTGTVTLPDNVAPLFPPTVYLKSISVTLYSKMNYTTLLDCKKVKNLNGARTYFPSKDVKWGFWAGIGVYFVKPKLVQAEAQLGMKFGPYGGLSQISLDGLVYFLSEKEDDSFIKGQLMMYYDFDNDIFRTRANFIADLHGKVKGEGEFSLFKGPESWYFNLGTVKKQVHLTIMDKIDAYTYFMLGDSVPTYLPPLDPEITNKFNVTQSGATATDNTEAFSNGTGFAFGAKLGVDLGPKKFIYANVTLKGGTDALVVRNRTECGDREYRGKGQTYLYMDLGAGVKPRKKKYCIVEFSALTMLEAEFPDPYFIVGRVDFRYSVLGGLFSGDAHAKFDIGKHCGPNGELIEGEGFTFDKSFEKKKLKDAMKDLLDSGELDDDEKSELQEDIDELNKEIEEAKSNDGAGNYDSETVNITEVEKDYEETYKDQNKKWNSLTVKQKEQYIEVYKQKREAEKKKKEEEEKKKANGDQTDGQKTGGEGK